MIVDTHVHVSPPEARPTSGDADVPMSKALAGRVSVEELLALMDRAGVDRSVLVAVGGEENDAYVADALRAHPDRLSGVCVLDVAQPDAGERLRYWVEERGLGGLRLFNAIESHAGAAFDDPRTLGLLAGAGSLRVPVCVVTRHAELAAVRSAIERFPQATFVLDHLGFYPVQDPPPFTPSEPLLALADLPNVHLKFSAVNQWAIRKGDVPARDYFEAILERFGPRRLLWGSNYPVTRFLPYPELVQLGREPFSFLGGDELRGIMGENAARLWPGPRAARS